MEKMRFEYPVRFVCHVLRCSVSGYYSWRKALRARPCPKDAGLRIAIVAAHQRTRQTYSAVRLHAELIADGVSTSLWKVKKLRRELGLRCKQQRKFVRTTDSRHNLPVAENLVGRHFIRNKCNQVWVSDITYIPTREGWLYLAGIKDVYSKEIVGFSLSERMDSNLVLCALTRAMHIHRPPVGLILHSDRGSQYCSKLYQERLKHYGMTCSMSRKGDCYDNAPMESFWGLLKNELVHHKRYQTRREAVQDVTEYIEIFYNRQRRQAGLGYISPVAFVQKQQDLSTQMAA